MINRTIAESICSDLNGNKVILVFGARQVGKTTLIENLNCIDITKTLFMSGDDADTRKILSDTTSTALKNLFIGYNVVVIDEAQQIKNVGITLKLIHDKIKDVRIIATGSSSFDLSNKASEPLTGRKFVYALHPISFSEMVNHHGLLEETRLLEHRLVFGYYPEIITNPGKEIRLLKLVAESYLFKDLLILENIKRSSYLEKLLKALALQVGSEVSYSELAHMTGADSKTIEKYIDLLEKTYVIFKLPGLSRNVRNEIRKGKKIYFWDNGIRNAVISNFQSVTQRTDSGALWENYLISERMKAIQYSWSDTTCYFWRTKQQQEIDFIEEENGRFRAYEFKWNSRKEATLSKTFSGAYPVEEFKTITPKNYSEFLLK